MASILKRGKDQWQAKVRKKGYPIQSKTCSTKAEAEKWARHIESEMDRGIFLSTAEAERITFAELLDRYQIEEVPKKKSSTDYLSRIGILKSALGHLVAAALTPIVIKEYRDYRLESVSNSTVRKDLSLISAVLNVAQKEWDIYLPRGNPVSSITAPSPDKARTRRLEAGEEERLLKAARAYGGEIHDIIVFAIETGMRRSEISTLKWKHIDLKKRTAKIFDTKNGEDRDVPLTGHACDLLRGLPRYISGYVFSMQPDSITRAFIRICVKDGIVGLRFHDLRHEAASRFFEMGLNIMEVAAITGHKDLGMLKRYTHLKAEDLARKLV